MAHISQNEFEKLNWLPISDRINQCILSTTFKFVNDMGPNYLNEVFQWAAESNRTLRNDYLKLKHPFRKTTAGQNSLCFLGPSKWNKLQKSVITLILSNIKKALSGTTCKLRKFIIATIIGSNNIFFFCTFGNCST